MNVSDESPVHFDDGLIVAPDDINAIWLYAADALDDVAEKRFARGILPLQFVESVGTPYTNAMNVEELTYRFRCPITCVVDRAFFHGNFTCAAELKVDITNTGGVAPSGATSPYLTSSGAKIISASDGHESQVAVDGVVASSADDIIDDNQDRVLLAANTEYLIKVSSAGAFSLERFDVILHVLVDRWTQSGIEDVPHFEPTLANDADARDATVQAANDSALTTQTNKLTRETMLPLLFVKHNFASASSVNVRKFALPLVDGARAKCHIKRIYVFAYTAGACTITATVKDAAGVTQATVSAVVTGTQKSQDSGALDLVLEGNTGDVADPTKDWSIEIANSSGVTSCIKAAVLVWVARS